MKRIGCFFTALVLLLTACGGRQPETVPAPEAPPQTVETPSAPDPEVPLWPESDVQAAVEYLTGAWHCYLPSVYDDVMWLYLDPDGTYQAAVDGGAGMWGWDEGEGGIYTYIGDWRVEDWEGDGVYLLCLDLTDTDDDQMRNCSSLGDYRVSLISYCDGEEVMDFRQMNNGDGLYTRWFMDIAAIALEREDTRPLTQTVQKDATFCAQIWKTEYEPVFRLFVDDVTVAEDGTVMNKVRESICYEVASDDTEGTCMLSGGPDGLFALGDTVYEITTNEKGEVVAADAVPSGPAPDEETAWMILQSVDEVWDDLDMGMTAMYEGWELLDGQKYCAVFSLGTDHPDQFVREKRYAVDRWGWVYAYDAVLDDWNWVE